MDLKKMILERAIMPHDGAADLSGLTARIHNLENIEHEHEIFKRIDSGTTGQIKTDGVTLKRGGYAGHGDCLIVADRDGAPDDNAVFTRDGDLVTGTISDTGDFTLSGEPASYPVYIIYWVFCKAKDHSKIELTERA